MRQPSSICPNTATVLSAKPASTNVNTGHLLDFQSFLFFFFALLSFPMQRDTAPLTSKPTVFDVAYHLSSLWIFVHERRAANVVPHLTRCHRKYHRLKDRMRSCCWMFSFCSQHSHNVEVRTAKEASFRVKKGSFLFCYIEWTYLPRQRYPKKFCCTETPSCFSSGKANLQSVKRAEPMPVSLSSSAVGRLESKNRQRSNFTKIRTV